ncbi:acyl-CoA dehydrogenase family protein [Dactylosporangium sp. CA-092794]|uniref:acyl-CoA dehydrogenase family protein n=1 Tax=Dactylosporangium sp. CA-092794 TaxID=3239929 RepID=UPI003D8A6087
MAGLPTLGEFTEFFTTQFETYLPELERTDQVPDELIKAAAALGAFRLTIPREYGGLGLHVRDYLPYLEAAAMGPGAARMLVHVANGLWRPLLQFGTPAQRAIVQGMAEGSQRITFALTERGAGTGRDIETRAVRDGDGWRLTGEKHLITFADKVDYFIVIAATDDRKASDSVTAFLVPRDVEGFDIDLSQRTMGLAGTAHAFLTFTGAYVDDSARLGEVGQGLDVAFSFLDYSRLSLAACMVGMGRRALAETAAYTERRVTFGKAIARRQAIQMHIADMETDIAAGAALVRSVVDLIDAGESFTADAATAKLYCLKMIGRVTDHALQAHGGYGFTTDAAIERIYRDARGFWFEEGTAEVQQLVVARHVLQREAAARVGSS